MKTPGLPRACQHVDQQLASVQHTWRALEPLQVEPPQAAARRASPGARLRPAAASRRCEEAAKKVRRPRSPSGVKPADGSRSNATLQPGALSITAQQPPQPWGRNGTDCVSVYKIVFRLQVGRPVTLEGDLDDPALTQDERRRIKRWAPSPRGPKKGDPKP